MAEVHDRHRKTAEAWALQFHQNTEIHTVAKNAYAQALADQEAEAELAELAPLRPSECQRFVDERLADVRECARKFGYAIALHGSLARDVDLVAVPWVAEVKPADALVAAIMDTVHRCDFCNGEQPEDNPHGRRSWSIWMHEYSTYLDVSVTPLLSDTKGDE